MNPNPVQNPCPGWNLTQYKLRNTVDEERWLIECRDCGWACWFPPGVPFSARELHRYRYGSEPDPEPAVSFERPEPNPI